MEAFYEYYHATGAELCSFYESSPEAIEAKLDGLLETLKVQPIVVSPSQEENGPLVPQKVSYSAVKRLVSAMLYQPYFERPTFSDILTGLDKGNSCPYYNHYNPTVALSPVCGSATFEEAIEDAEYLIDWSPATGAFNWGESLRCAGRTVRPKWRFKGTWHNLRTQAFEPLSPMTCPYGGWTKNPNPVYQQQGLTP